MLLPEQKKILEELITYLQDKPVGSIEFLAFSDITQERISLQGRRSYRDLDDMTAMTAIAAITIIEQAVKLMLVERDIERNKALLPGYFQALEKIADFWAELEYSYYDPSKEEYDEKKILAAFDNTTYKFRLICDTILKGELPLELSTIDEDDDD